MIEVRLSCAQGGVTPASDVFGGALRSEVRAQGAPPSATLEPCFLVHLDIHPETVHSVSDALSAFTSPETISGASLTMLLSQCNAILPCQHAERHGSFILWSLDESREEPSQSYSTGLPTWPTGM